MRYTLLLCLLTACLPVCAQATWRPGYVVTDDGRRQDVEIYDLDWVDTPTRFRYRAGSETRTVGTDEVRAFGLADGSLRFLRQRVAIDRSGDAADELTTSDKPDFREETVFLEWLVDGAADLFYWEEGETRRFFYRLDDAPLTPLIKRRYLRGSQIVDQDQFRGTLRAAVNCRAADRELRSLRYTRRDLVAYFEQDNRCRGGASVTLRRRDNGERARLYLRAGGNVYFGHALFGNNFNGHDERPLLPTYGVMLGPEAEVFLPRANHRWSATGGVYLQRSSSGNEEIPPQRSSLDLRSVNLPLGVRRYFYLGRDRALFLHAIGLLQFPWNSRVVATTQVRSYGFDASWNFGAAAGAGVQWNRLVVEVRYTHDQDVLQKYVTNSTYYRSVGLVAGYRLLP